jgi:hypothetical protein
VAAGRYEEDERVVGKAVRLWGRCPSLTEVAGATFDGAALGVAQRAAGTEIRGFAVTGAGWGVVVRGASEVTIDRLWIHETSLVGVAIAGDLGTTSATLSRSVVEGTGSVAVYTTGATATVESSVLRDTRPGADGQLGRGVYVESDLASRRRGALTLRASLVERNREIGLFGIGADLLVDASVVRDTEASRTGQGGNGIAIESDGTATSACSSSMGQATSPVHRYRRTGSAWSSRAPPGRSSTSSAPPSGIPRRTGSAAATSRCPPPLLRSLESGFRSARPSLDPRKDARSPQSARMAVRRAGPCSPGRGQRACDSGWEPMRRLALLLSCCLAPTLLACWKPRHGSPEFLPASGITRTKPASGPGADYVGAAVTLASAVAVTAVDRKIYDICYASCQDGTACDNVTGMCVPLPCRGKCPADYRCKEVEGKETCVLETPDSAARD